MCEGREKKGLVVVYIEYMKEDDLILKWLNGELTESELKAFKKTREYRDYKDLIAHSENLPKPQFDKERGWQELTERLSTSKSSQVRKLHFPQMYKIAAALVVLFASGLFFFLNRPEVITTGYSEVAVLELPDESIVKLNAGSTVEYNPSKWDKNRNIQLEGEAFFQVEKGQQFTVVTNQGKVQVLGTEFNVKDRTGYFEVSCYEGAVAVKTANREIILRKGNSIRIIDGVLSDMHLVQRSAPGWTFQESTFDSVPLKQVIAELERQFAIEIDLQNVDPNQLFSGSFNHGDKELALKAVSMPLHLRYKFQSAKKVVLYGD